MIATETYRITCEYSTYTGVSIAIFAEIKSYSSVPCLLQKIGNVLYALASNTGCEIALTCCISRNRSAKRRKMADFDPIESRNTSPTLTHD